MIDLQLLLQCDRENIASIFMRLLKKLSATNFSTASLPTRDCVQNWNTQLSAGDINERTQVVSVTYYRSPPKLLRNCVRTCESSGSSSWKRMFLSKQWNSQLQTGGHFRLEKSNTLPLKCFNKTFIQYSSLWTMRAIYNNYHVSQRTYQLTLCRRVYL